MRYTECRLQALAAAALLADLDSNTVDFADNFDGSQQEPVVLPARVPLLLVNGTGGIAVGIATKIPPHNLRELVSALEALALKPDISIAALMKHVPAPDFPTGMHMRAQMCFVWSECFCLRSATPTRSTIIKASHRSHESLSPLRLPCHHQPTTGAEVLINEGVHDAYSQGRGSITMRATSHIEEAAEAKRKAGGKSLVVITELPYQVYKVWVGRRSDRGAINIDDNTNKNSSNDDNDDHTNYYLCIGLCSFSWLLWVSLCLFATLCCKPFGVAAWPVHDMLLRLTLLSPLQSLWKTGPSLA